MMAGSVSPIAPLPAPPGAADGQADASATTAAEFAAILSGVLGAATVRPAARPTAATPRTDTNGPAEVEASEGAESGEGDGTTDATDGAMGGAAPAGNSVDSVDARAAVSTLLAAAVVPNVAPTPGNGPQGSRPPMPAADSTKLGDLPAALPGSTTPAPATRSGSASHLPSAPNGVSVGESLAAAVVAVLRSAAPPSQTSGDGARVSVDTEGESLLPAAPATAAADDAVVGRPPIRLAGASSEDLSGGGESDTGSDQVVPPGTERETRPDRANLRSDHAATALDSGGGAPPPGVTIDVGGAPRSAPVLTVKMSPAPTPLAPPEPPVPVAGPQHATVRFTTPDGRESRIRVSVVGDTVRATIMTDAHAAPAMERALPELQRSLSDRGFADAQVSVRVVGDAAPQPAPRPESPGGDGGRHRGDGSAGERSRDFAGQDRPRQRRHHPGEEAHP
jgi:hypothetical protein